MSSSSSSTKNTTATTTTTTPVARPPGLPPPKRIIDVKPCLQLTLLFIVIALVIWTIFSNVMWRLVRTNENYYRFCVDANEHRVRPYRNESELTNPKLFLSGYWALDYPQLEVRWQLSGPLYGVTLASIDLRGPTTHSHEEVAPVAFAMGLQKDKHSRYYEGIVDITGELATDIVRKPFRYYISLQDTAGREVARDLLDKRCNNNI